MHVREPGKTKMETSPPNFPYFSSSMFTTTSIIALLCVDLSFKTTGPHLPAILNHCSANTISRHCLIKGIRYIIST